MDYRPDFITQVDFPWLEKAIEVYRSCAGHKLSIVDKHLNSHNHPFHCLNKFARAKRHLDKEWTNPLTRSRSRELRVNCLEQINAMTNSPDANLKEQIIDSVMKQAGIGSKDELERGLVEDLSGQRYLTKHIPQIATEDCAAQINLAFAKSLLYSANHVEIDIKGYSRKVIQIAKLKGLLCVIYPTETGVILNLSGPLSLNGKTAYYGKAFASILSVLPWCDHYTLRANCDRKGRRFILKLKSGDPIRPSQTPKKYDSKLEENFAQKFTATESDWTLIREPRPIVTDLGVMFPDFEIIHKVISSRRIYLEIVGWWTPEYLQQKFKSWESVNNCQFILCVSQDIKHDVSAFKERVITFKRNVNVKEVMNKIDNLTSHIRTTQGPDGRGIAILH